MASQMALCQNYVWVLMPKPRLSKFYTGIFDLDTVFGLFECRIRYSMIHYDKGSQCIETRAMYVQ